MDCCQGVGKNETHDLAFITLYMHLIYEEKRDNLSVVYNVVHQQPQTPRRS